MVYENLPEALLPFVAKYHGTRNSPSPIPQLILENLVGGMDAPCIMDLKVGRRQHSDGDSPEKIAKKVWIAESTTTAATGLRLHGMKMISRAGNWVSMDKFQGRQLSRDSLVETILSFLPTTALRQEALKQVRGLIMALAGLSGFRFITSSLLLAYDARSEFDENSSNLATSSIVKVKLIDFAHTVHPTELRKISYQGPDEDFISGLVYLEDIINQSIDC